MVRVIKRRISGKFRFLNETGSSTLVIASLVLLNTLLWRTLTAPADFQSPLLEIGSPSIGKVDSEPKQCAPRDGIIVLNTMGLLANNLFEVAFANRLAADLCWKVLYRPYWNTELPSARGTECFPNAMLPDDHRTLDISPLLQETLRMDSSRWERLSESSAKANDQYLGWINELEQEGLGMRLKNTPRRERFDFTGGGPDRLVDQIRNETSQISLVGLEMFFIHYDWMAPWVGRIREWFAMNESCCHHHPPDDAVVIHVRDFTMKDDPHVYTGIKPAVYTHILSHYNLTERPLWIVCQPKTANSTFVQELVAATPTKSATIVTGQDQYDAFCTVTRGKTLILSSASTFSQMAAFLAGPTAQVHYPLTELDAPKVTISVPEWQYHLVGDSLDSVIEYNVSHGKLRAVIA